MATPRAALAASLATLGKRIEEHYGTPQIVEWALDRDGHAWLLQSGALA